MKDLNNSIYVRGYRLSSGADRHEFKPYVYGGDQPFVPPPPPTVFCAGGDCTEPILWRGFCQRHYSWHVTQGKPLGTPLPARRQAGRFLPEKCGTPAGYQQHGYYGIPVCTECRTAWSRKCNERRKRKAS